MQTDLTKTARQLKAEGKLTEEGMQEISKANREAIRNREETKLDRVHGGKVEEKALRDHHVWVDGRFIQSRYVDSLYRDSFLGIDVICP